MENFQTFTGIAALLDRANVDTDAIMPKQFLKSIKKTGYGPYAFDEWRYLDHGEPGMDCRKRPLNPDFSLNEPRYKDASILVTRQNFGCGSSREHAVWGIKEMGFKAMISPEFAEIFHNNCFKNGLLPITLTHDQVSHLFETIYENPGYQLTIDLNSQTVTTQDDTTFVFHIEPSAKERLVEGLDDVAITMKLADKIKAYEEKQQKKTPWLFANLR